MRYQTLFKEYVWLVNIIAQYKRITFEDINKKWLETEMSEGIELARSTFNRHKDAIEDIFGIYIECDRKDGYRYYIGNSDVLNKETIQNWMLSTMTVNNLLSEHKSIHNRVLLEAVPSSEVFLSDLITAMKRDLKVRIFYQKYSDEPGKERIVAPYCLKLYRRRWYVLAQIENGEMRLFSLDRIFTLSLTDEKFDMPKDFVAEEYFMDYIGVMTDSDIEKQRIVLRAYAREKYYLRDLPLHPSQREIAKTDSYVDFEYNLVPTSDFIRQLISRGGLERVMEPQWLADKLQEMFHYAADMYDIEGK